MPSGFSLDDDPQRDHLWSRVVELVDDHPAPSRRPHQAERDEDSITWLIEGSDGSETHITVRERPFIDVPFQSTEGRAGVWADLAVLRVGLSTLVAFRVDPGNPGPWLELTSRPGEASLAISVRDDVGTWYPQISSWVSGSDDFGVRFSPPPREARTLLVVLEDRGVLLAEYTAALPLPLKLE